MGGSTVYIMMVLILIVVFFLFVCFLLTSDSPSLWN